MSFLRLEYCRDVYLKKKKKKNLFHLLEWLQLEQMRWNIKYNLIFFNPLALHLTFFSIHYTKMCFFLHINLPDFLMDHFSGSGLFCVANNQNSHKMWDFLVVKMWFFFFAVDCITVWLGHTLPKIDKMHVCFHVGLLKNRLSQLNFCFVFFYYFFINKQSFFHKSTKLLLFMFICQNMGFSFSLFSKYETVSQLILKFFWRSRKIYF